MADHFVHRRTSLDDLTLRRNAWTPRQRVVPGATDGVLLSLLAYAVAMSKSRYLPKKGNRGRIKKKKISVTARNEIGRCVSNDLRRNIVDKEEVLQKSGRKSLVRATLAPPVNPKKAGTTRPLKKKKKVTKPRQWRSNEVTTWARSNHDRFFFSSFLTRFLPKQINER